MPEIATLLDPIQKIHAQIRDTVLDACTHLSTEELSAIAHNDEAGDTLFAIDRISETRLLSLFEDWITEENAIVLIAEGLEKGARVIPEGLPEQAARWRVLVDPIDGTRGLMYQKRSAWILTGVAPNKGPNTSLADINLAVQTEIPLVKQHLSDNLWSIKGQGAKAERYNRLTGQTTPLFPRPSSASSIQHGYAMLARFFPGARTLLAEIDDEIVAEILGPIVPGKAHCFEDQYISTGGQLYELMMGHDRFVADLRPYAAPFLNRRGQALGLCCHPYDLATVHIAQELGISVTNGAGGPLNAPLDTTADVAWAGFANSKIREQVEPILINALAKRGLLPHMP